VVETFLREPRLFAHYVAFDPSLWWNQGALVDSARALVIGPPVVLSRKASPRSAFRSSIYFAGSRDDIDNNTARLAEILRTLASRGFSWTYVARPDLTHGNIFRALAPAALAGALR